MVLFVLEDLAVHRETGGRTDKVVKMAATDRCLSPVSADKIRAQIIKCKQLGKHAFFLLPPHSNKIKIYCSFFLFAHLILELISRFCFLLHGKEYRDIAFITGSIPFEVT